jgi:hypothetical protein
VVLISSFNICISIEFRYLSKDTIWILTGYHYLAALKELIDELSFFTALRISSLANSSISTIEPCFRSPEIASIGVFYSLKRRMCSGSLHLLIAKLIANKRSGILIDLFVFSLKNRILLLIEFRFFLGASSLLRFFLLTKVYLSNLMDCSKTKLFSLAISIKVFFTVF